MPDSVVTVDYNLRVVGDVTGGAVVSSTSTSTISKPSEDVTVDYNLRTVVDVLANSTLDPVVGAVIERPAQTSSVDYEVVPDLVIDLGKLYTKTANETYNLYANSFESEIDPFINSGWDRNSGSTGSSGTGPSSAYDGSYYMYTENSGGDAGSHKYLTIEEPTYATLKLKFAYHMYGSAIGSLAVEGLVNGDWEEVWRKDGAQGNEWHLEEIVFGKAYEQVRFHEWGASSYSADVAIDMVEYEAGTILYEVGQSSNVTSAPVDISNLQENGLVFTADVPDGTSIDLLEVGFSESADIEPAEWFELTSLSSGVSIPFDSGTKFDSLEMWLRGTFTTDSDSKSAILSDIVFQVNVGEEDGSPYNPPSGGSDIVVVVKPAKYPMKSPVIMPNVK